MSVGVGAGGGIDPRSIIGVAGALVAVGGALVNVGGTVTVGTSRCKDVSVVSVRVAAGVRVAASAGAVAVAAPVRPDDVAVGRATVKVGAAPGTVLVCPVACLRAAAASIRP